MSGTYVSQNGTGEFEIRPFQIEGVCNVNEGHSHNYDHWIRVLSGGIRITARQPSKWQVGDIVYATRDEAEQAAQKLDTFPKEILGDVVSEVEISAGDEPKIPATRFDGSITNFHAFVSAPLWHQVKALSSNTRYECCFLHRDFDTGEVIQTYNGNPLATT